MILSKIYYIGSHKTSVIFISLQAFLLCYEMTTITPSSLLPETSQPFVCEVMSPIISETICLCVSYVCGPLLLI